MADREVFESSQYGEGPSQLLPNLSRRASDDIRQVREEIRKAELRKDFGACLTLCCEAVKMSPADQNEFLIMKAAFLVQVRRSDEANEILSEILGVDPHNAKALAVLGLIFNRQGNLKKSVEVFTSALQIDSGLKSTADLRKKALRLVEIFKQLPDGDSPKENFTPQVGRLIAEGLAIDSSNPEVMKILLHRQGNHEFINLRYREAIKALTQALLIDEENLALFLLRAKGYIAVSFFDDAMIDLLEADKLNKRQNMCNNKFSLEIEKLRREIGKVYVPKTNYDFLEVSRTAIESEIALSYKNLTILHKVNIAKATTAAEKRKLEFKYKRVENAFVMLTTKALKEKYDRHLAKQEDSIECPTLSACCANIGHCYQGCCGGLGNCFDRMCTGTGNCCQGLGNGCGDCCDSICSGCGKCWGSFCGGCGNCVEGYGNCCDVFCKGFGHCLAGLGGCLRESFCTDNACRFFGVTLLVSTIGGIIFGIGYVIYQVYIWFSCLFGTC